MDHFHLHSYTATQLRREHAYSTIHSPLPPPSVAKRVEPASHQGGTHVSGPLQAAVAAGSGYFLSFGRGLISSSSTVWM